jgi:cyclohexanone monooxygenase
MGPAGASDVVCDFWTEVNRNIAKRLDDMGNPRLDIGGLVALREEEDYKVMERLRRRIESIVTDKATAEALKPYYRFMCKRPCSNDDYLPTFNRPNVTLVDVSATQGIERVTEKGIVANGKEYAVDLIIYASGFEISPRDQKAGWGIAPLAGRNGLSLYDHWGNSFKTLHGMTSHGFPNQFFTGFTQAGAGANTTAIYEQQGEHIAYIISEAMKRGAKRLSRRRRRKPNGCRPFATTPSRPTSSRSARPAITTMKAAAMAAYAARWASRMDRVSMLSAT